MTGILTAVTDINFRTDRLFVRQRRAAPSIIGILRPIRWTDNRRHMADLDRLKLKFTPWHCDKDPYGFLSFVQSNTAVMRSLQHGADIENFLDIKLQRKTIQAMMV